MSLFGEVPDHEAWVGGPDVELDVPISSISAFPDGYLMLEITGDDASDYSFVGSPRVTPSDSSVRLRFSPHGASRSHAKLLVASRQEEVHLNGLGKNPIVFSDDAHDFGTVLLGQREVKSFTVTNHGSSDANLSLEGQVDGDDTSAYTLSPTSIPATGVPIAVTLTFAPSEVKHYNANVAAGIGDLEVILAGTGKGSQDTVEEGTIQQTFREEAGALQPSAATRFSVFVPEHSSRLNMGKPSPADAGANPIKINGVGLTTTEKILLNACGSNDDSQVGVQANGSVYIQSNHADVLSLSDGNNVMAAGGAAYVLGDGGVLIATTVDGPTSKGDDDFPNADLSGDSSPLTAAGAAAAFFSAADAFIALCGAIRAARYFKLDNKSKSSKVAAAAAGITAVTATLVSAVGATPAAAPAVTIYGHAGVLIGTPGFGGVHCALGLALTSAYPIMGGLDCEIFGLHGVKVTGRETSLQSLVETTVKSHGKVSISADAVTPPYVPGSKAIAGALAGDVTIDAAGKIALAAAETYKLEVTDSGVTIQQVSSPDTNGKLDVASRAVILQLNKIKITLESDNGITIDDGAKGKIEVYNGGMSFSGAKGEAITLVQGKVEIASGSSKIKAATSGTEVKGSRILLG